MVPPIGVTHHARKSHTIGALRLPCEVCIPLNQFPDRKFCLLSVDVISGVCELDVALQIYKE